MHNPVWVFKISRNLVLSQPSRFKKQMSLIRCKKCGHTWKARKQLEKYKCSYCRTEN